MQMDSSARRTGRECASAFEYARTVRMPISRALRRMRSAISPRLAIKSLWKMLAPEDAAPVRFQLRHAETVLAREVDRQGLARAEPAQEPAHRRHPAPVYQIAHNPQH